MSKYCQRCGYEVVRSKPCPNCGARTRAIAIKRRVSIPDRVASPMSLETLTPEAIAFLKARGFSQERLPAVAPFLSRRLPDHVFFPIVEDGEMVSWQARYYRGDEKGKIKYGARWDREKWQSPHRDEPFLTTKSVVWNIDAIEPGYPVHVCESIIDAEYFNDAMEIGVQIGVSVSGWLPTEVQALKILDRSPSIVYLALDSTKHPRGLPESAWCEAEKVFRSLDRLVEIRRVEPPEPFKDFGELLAVCRR